MRDRMLPENLCGIVTLVGAFRSTRLPSVMTHLPCCPRLSFAGVVTCSSAIRFWLLFCAHFISDHFEANDRNPAFCCRRF